MNYANEGSGADHRFLWSALVIGYGNPLRGDDGAGPYVARQLGAPAIACHQLTPELAEPISQAQRVIFVDAHAGIPPGEISVQPIQPQVGASIHRFTPEALLACARQLYGRAPEALLIGLGPASLELGEGLSPEALRAADAALGTIRELIA